MKMSPRTSYPFLIPYYPPPTPHISPLPTNGPGAQEEKARSQNDGDVVSDSQWAENLNLSLKFHEVIKKKLMDIEGGREGCPKSWNP